VGAVGGVGTGARVGRVGDGALVGMFGGLGEGAIGALMLMHMLMNCNSRFASISVSARWATFSHKASNCSLALLLLSIRLRTIFFLLPFPTSRAMTEHH
jgi:hypothetical protein